MYVVHTVVVGGLAYYVLQCTYWTFNSQYKTSKSFVVRACEKKKYERKQLVSKLFFSSNRCKDPLNITVTSLEFMYDSEQYS